MEVAKAGGGIRRIVMSEKDFGNALKFCRLEPRNREIAHRYLVERLSVAQLLKEYPISKVRLFDIRRRVLNGYHKYQENIGDPKNKLIPLARTLFLDLDLFPVEMYLIGDSANSRITEIVKESNGVNAISRAFASGIHSWMANFLDKEVAGFELKQIKRIRDPEEAKVKKNEKNFNRGWNSMVRMAAAVPSVLVQREIFAFGVKRSKLLKIQEKLEKINTGL